MGVPAFFRWISEKYPKIIVEVLEEKLRYINGHPHPPDLNQPNPNGVEFDNLYIDMNGIIHPCSHPEDRPAPRSEEEMYMNVFEYVDRLFAAVRPRKVLFLAIDGVAPRAKMNQQRSRRFRAAQDAKERREMLEEVKQEMLDMGLSTSESDKHEWDSNVITPGTEFMDKLALYLEYYILERMNTYKAWRDITVILSDASEPGEGEHKIMSFVRRQRTMPGYDPNTWHVLHGLDADLIMLALATHEVRFTISREEVLFGRQQRDKQVNQAQAMLDAQANGEEKVEVGAERDTVSTSWVYNKPLQFLHTHVLREYLVGEFASLQGNVLPFEYNLERVIDDFVFMCFFVGNDFLPHLPSLDIRDGAIDFLIETYKQLLPSLGGYLTHGAGDVNLSRVDVILAKVGEIEDIVFRMRKDAEDREQQRRERNQRNGVDPRKERGREGAALLQHSRESGSIVAIAENREDQKSRLVTSTHTRFYDNADASASHLDIMKRKLLDSVELKKLNDVSGSANRQENESAADRLREQLQGSTGQTSSDQVAANEEEPEHEAGVKRLRVDSNDAEQPTTKLHKTQGSEETDGENATSQVEMSLESRDFGVIVETHVDVIAQETVDEVKMDEVVTETEVQDAEKELKERMKVKQNALIDKYRTEVKDNIRFHEQGWKERYYKDDFKRQNIEEGGGKERMIQTYVEGLCWVFKYYYDGCPSWKWYYPFHYAPFASDLVNIDQLDIQFEESEPFRPIEQLLAVLPPASANALPAPCRPLMLDPSSPIADFYPTQIVLDTNGKALPWLWVTLLPFIDEGRLKDALASVISQFTEDEQQRNTIGFAHTFIHSSHPIQQSPTMHSVQQLTTAIRPETAGDAGEHPMIESGTDITPAADGTSFGGKLTAASDRFRVSVGEPVQMPAAAGEHLVNIEHNQVYVFGYHLPEYKQHNPNRFTHADLPIPVLGPMDLVPKRPPRLNKGRYHILDIANDHQRMNGSAGQMRYEHGVASSQRMIVNHVQSGGGGEGRYDDSNRGGSGYRHTQYHSDSRGGDYQRRDPRSSYHSQSYHSAPPAQHHNYQAYPPSNAASSYHHPPQPYHHPRGEGGYHHNHHHHHNQQQQQPQQQYQHRPPPPQPQDRRARQGFSFQAPQQASHTGYPQQAPPAHEVPNLASLTAQLAETLRRDQHQHQHQHPPAPGSRQEGGQYYERGAQHRPAPPPPQYGGGGGRGREAHARDPRHFRDPHDFRGARR